MKTKPNLSAGFLPLLALIIIGAIAVGSAGYGITKYEQRKHETQKELQVVIPPEEKPTTTASSPKVEQKAEIKTSVTKDKETIKTDAKVSTAVAIDPDLPTKEEIEKEQAQEARRQAVKEQRDQMLRELAAEKAARGAQTRETSDPQACIDQKKSLVSAVEAKYELWYKDWQNARTELNSCTDTQSVPYCDGKMSELNVQWQAKWKATLKPYYDKLTKCAAEDRRFGDVSTTLSSY